MTERVDHAAEAARHQDAAWAQVHATLALVEQQRIANLISMYGAERRGEDASRFTPIPKITDAALDQAVDGLGLS